jgi:hypothetical protein
MVSLDLVWLGRKNTAMFSCCLISCVSLFSDSKTVNEKTPSEKDSEYSREKSETDVKIVAIGHKVCFMDTVICQESNSTSR